MSRATTKKASKGGRKLAGLALMVGGAAALELTHRARVKSDPQWSDFKNYLHGDPVTTTSADGTSIYAEVFGRSDAPTFVLVPGWTEQLRYFDPLTRVLTARGFRVVVYDLRGQGKSGNPESRTRVLENYGEDLEAVLEATCEGRDDVTVAGHSMGGMSIVAWGGKYQAAARVKAAALINTGQATLVADSRILPARVPLAAREVIGAKYILGGTAAYLPVSNALLRAATKYMAFGPDATEAQLAFYEPMMWEMNPKSRGAAGIALSKLAQLELVANLDVPTLVIAGENDRMTPPSHAEKTFEQLPFPAGLVILPRTGHMGPLERTQEIADELCKLARSVGVTTVAAV